GDGDTTDRGFTIGAAGATLDASGSGALVFTNPTGVVTQDSQPRNGLVGVANFNDRIRNIATHDLFPGMTLTIPNMTPEQYEIERIEGNLVYLREPIPQTSQNNANAGTREISFGPRDRELRLTGTNTDLNTIT